MVRTQEPYRDGTEMLRDPVRSAESAEMDADFRVLEWQQLANESAMKQELMLQPKMTRSASHPGALLLSGAVLTQGRSGG